MEKSSDDLYRIDESNFFSSLGNTGICKCVNGLDVGMTAVASRLPNRGS
jgi:hypothetical protein